MQVKSLQAMSLSSSLRTCKLVHTMDLFCEASQEDGGGVSFIIPKKTISLARRFNFFLEKASCAPSTK